MYKLLLATRYLVKRRITYFAVLAVTLCVFIVVVVMTVMVGVVDGFKLKNHRFVGDCVVGTESLVGFPYYDEFAAILEQTDFVEATSPVIRGYALLSTDSESNFAVEILGLDPGCHSNATSFGQTLHFRVDEPEKAFVPTYDPSLFGCVLGIDLALQRSSRGQYNFESRPGRIAFSITCFPLTAKGALAKAGAGLVNTQTFYYSDHSYTGLARVDASLVYLPFEQVQLLCGMTEPTKRATALHVKFAPHVRIAAACERVDALWRQFRRTKSLSDQAFLLDQVTVKSWKSARRAFIAPMEKEQALLALMFGFVGLTTVFIILVVFYMIVSHKSKDIGLLKSLGVSGGGVVQLFCGFASMVGLSGSALGSLAAWVFLTRINQIEAWLYDHWHFQLMDRGIYPITEIPHDISAAVLVTVIASAVAACMLGALIPTLQAARLRPVDTLHVGPI